jgi:hypothetical protein
MPVFGPPLTARPLPLPTLPPCGAPPGLSQRARLASRGRVRRRRRPAPCAALPDPQSPDPDPFDRLTPPLSRVPPPPAACGAAPIAARARAPCRPLQCTMPPCARRPPLCNTHASPQLVIGTSAPRERGRSGGAGRVGAARARGARRARHGAQLAAAALAPRLPRPGARAAAALRRGAIVGRCHIPSLADPHAVGPVERETRRLAVASRSPPPPRFRPPPGS